MESSTKLFLSNFTLNTLDML